MTSSIPCATKPSCAPFSGEIRGSTEVIVPMPMNETDAMASTIAAARKFASGMCRPNISAMTTKRTALRSTP